MLETILLIGAIALAAGDSASPAVQWEFGTEEATSLTTKGNV